MGERRSAHIGIIRKSYVCSCCCLAMLHSNVVRRQNICVYYFTNIPKCLAYLKTNLFPFEILKNCETHSLLIIRYFEKIVQRPDFFRLRLNIEWHFNNSLIAMRIGLCRISVKPFPQCDEALNASPFLILCNLVEYVELKHCLFLSGCSENNRRKMVIIFYKIKSEE